MAELRLVFTQLGIPTTNGAEYVFNEDTSTSPQVAVSQLGTPVVSNIVFQPGSYSRDGKTVEFEGLRMDTVLMSVSNSKNIVRTPVANRNGTVKEYISDGDFSISISGRIVDPDNDTYPLDDVNALIEICKVPEALEFSSSFIDQFGAFDLVITDYSFPETEGGQNFQEFSINLISDNPIELQLNEEALL